MSKHDQLQADAYQWANNTFPQIRGKLFAARSEVIRYPGETEKAFLARLGHLKGIGHRKGILDLHLDMPLTRFRHGAPYEFDAKVKPDYLKPDQADRIDSMRQCGGGGWAFFSLEEFQRIFTDVMKLHFEGDLIIEEKIFHKTFDETEAALKRVRIQEIRKGI